MIDHLHAVVPAGGAGTRLWPLSRAARPKFLLDLDDSGRTLIQHTWDRLLTIVPPERITVVTGPAHADRIREQLPELTRLLVEPSPRNSMPAIGWAAAVVAEEDPDAVIGSFAADHRITDSAAFADTIAEAGATARAGLVATVGITPDHASTAYGYIETGPSLDLAAAPTALSITSFVEKPDEATARRYLDDGRYRWNAGMFVSRADVLLDHLARLQPALHDGLRAIARAPERLADVWPTLTPIAIDHAVAEPVSREGGLAVVPGEFAWDDVGDFASLARLRSAVDQTVWVDADGLVISDDEVPVAVVGIRDAVVIRTADATLVTTTAHAQRVGEVPKLLRERGRTDLV